MRVSFVSLPAEIRIEIYKHLLVGRRPISPWNIHRKLVPNLLFANTMTFHEARSLLYRYSCFDFSWRSYGQICQFFDVIGRTKTSHIQYIRVDFPQLRDIEDNISLEKDSALTMALIQSRCTSLKCLIAAPHSTESMEYKLDWFDNPKICERALALVDTHFRTIPSLRETIIEVHEDGPSSYIRKKMKILGWILVLVEKVEPWDTDESEDAIEENWSF